MLYNNTILYCAVRAEINSTELNYYFFNKYMLFRLYYMFISSFKADFITKFQVIEVIQVIE